MKSSVRLSFALTSALALAACAGGPERAPHQPVKGVDTEKNEVDNPHDKKGGPTTQTDRPRGDQPEPEPKGGPVAKKSPTGGSFLDEFVAAIAGAHRVDPGIVAVFPALSRDGTGASFVDGLGEYLMEETAGELEVAGVSPLAYGPGLKNEIYASNRGLGALRAVDDVFWLADRIGAKYAIYGSVRKREFDRLDRDVQVDVRYLCRHLESGRTVAAFRPRLDGDHALTAKLVRYMRIESADWKVGGRAASFTPSLQAEVKWVGRAIARKLAGAHGKMLNGKSLRMPPTRLAAAAGIADQLRRFTIAFDRELDKAERKLTAGGATDAEQKALEVGPIEVLDKIYADFNAALDAFREMRGEYQTSAAGQLAADLGNGLQEALSREVPSLEVLARDSEKETLLNVLRREAREYRTAGSVDPDTIKELLASGTDVLVRSTLRQDVSTYALRVTLFDLKSGQRYPVSVPFESTFSAGLAKAFAR